MPKISLLKELAKFKKLCFKKKIFVTVVAFPLRINGEVLRNDDFTEFSAIFTTQESRRIYGEGTLNETEIHLRNVYTVGCYI